MTTAGAPDPSPPLDVHETVWTASDLEDDVKHVAMRYVDPIPVPDDPGPEVTEEDMHP